MAILMQVLVDPPGGRFDDIKTLADIIGTSITALALIIGGVWAYFKFARGRTFESRVAVSVTGQMRSVGGKRLFYSRVTIRNIGATKASLVQMGTGLKISSISNEAIDVPSAVQWRALGAFSIFEGQSWIEPGETMSDDLLIDLGPEVLLPVLCEIRLVWQRSRRQRIVTHDKCIITDEPSVNTEFPS